MSWIIRLVPRTIEGQMIAILSVSLVLLLSALTILEIIERGTPIDWAESGATLSRVQRMHAIFEYIDAEKRVEFLHTISACHDGYTLTESRFTPVEFTPRTSALRARVARLLAVDEPSVSVGYAKLTQDDFSYRECGESDIDLPMTAIVVSIKLRTSQWLNIEVHPHEWHVQDLIARILHYSAAFVVVGGLAIFLIRQLSKPLRGLTYAAQRFGDGLHVSPVTENGPPDLRRAIQAFNAMQRQVADEVRKRSETLAAISHDLRTPLTALRIKAELVDDVERRTDLVASIEKMEQIIASGLEFLKGESRSEPLRAIDLSAMLASECSDFEEAGQKATFIGENDVHYTCRPEALARAVRNLVENANKYGNGATVDLRTGAGYLEISVSDTGPGIPEDKVKAALEPFIRLSKARESQKGGFGLGLAVVKAVAQGHNGDLILTSNEPSGLIALLQLPMLRPHGR